MALEIYSPSLICIPARRILQFRLRTEESMAAPNRVPPISITSPHAEDVKARSGLDLAFYLKLKSVIHHYLLNKIDVEELSGAPVDRTRSRVIAAAQEIVAHLKVPLSESETERLSLEVLEEVFGLGPLEPLLQDPKVSDILVNGAKLVYVERAGILEETKVVFRDDAHLMCIINKIISAVGRRVDESSPMVDARLSDGSRVHVILPPLAIDGPHLSIRCFGRTPMTEEDLLANQTLTPRMLAFLKTAVSARLNIVISGGTGAGKTTLLNVLSGYISPKERVVTIEDSAELQLKQRHVVRLECRPPDSEGKYGVQARQLVISSLRMRPNRIIVGEVRGEEAFDMLQAMNTGHEGSLTTVHANSPRDALARMEAMAMMANLELSEKAIRKQIASAVNLVLQVARFSDGARHVTRISEITGMEGDVITLQELFVYEKGIFSAMGIRPKFAETLRASGITLPADLFETNSRGWG